MNDGHRVAPMCKKPTICNFVSNSPYLGEMTNKCLTQPLSVISSFV